MCNCIINCIVGLVGCQGGIGVTAGGALGVSVVVAKRAGVDSWWLPAVGRGCFLV
jgi:hypothetical protein